MCVCVCVRKGIPVWTGWLQEAKESHDYVFCVISPRMRPLTIKLKPLDFVHGGEMAEWSYKHIKSFLKEGTKQS